jgi:hypothetical protein
LIRNALKSPEDLKKRKSYWGYKAT